ncbi:MAG: hypothetical protein IJR82_02070 [Bacilli bacterium]|nr:hypothetical protein [Bacilli bacterium]
MDGNKIFDELTEKFDSLVKKDKLDINAIEDLMLVDIEKYKEKQIRYIEHLLKNHINEKELISKKNKNGVNKDLI